jgi:predicted glutamine amidotransferase
MCKLFIATGSFTQAQVIAMLAATNRLFADSQRDGFGFIAYGSKKSAAYGKYLDPASYPGFGVELPKWVHNNRIEVGNIPKVTTALVIHGRTSTNRVMIENVHPFHSKGTFLAHNGVLSWIGKGPVPEAKNGCDTEQFFNWLKQNHDDESAWASTHEHWSGYGVFGIVNATNGTLTVAKCGSGNLRWVGDKGNHFFSTDGNDLMRITRAAKFKFNKTSEMARKTRVVFKLTGTGSAVQSVVDWKGFGTRVIDDSWRRSMGYGHSKQDQWRWDGDTKTYRKGNDHYGVAKTSEKPTVAVNPSPASDPFRGVSVPRYPDTERDMFPDYDPAVHPHDL